MSELTAWCDACGQESLMADDGSCVWCDGPTRRKRAGGPPKGKYRLITDDQLRAAHRVYVLKGLSCRQLGDLLYEKLGYRSARACGEALYRGFKDLALARRSQSEVTIARNYRHGRKRRGLSAEEQQAYRRFRRDENGWNSTHGPGRPVCKAALTGACGRKGRPCSLHAMEGSEFCYCHDPAGTLERRAALTRARRRLASRDTVPIEPFAGWVDGLYAQLGLVSAVAGRLGCSTSTAHNILRRQRSTSGGGRVAWVETDRARVEGYLEAAGGPPLTDLYEIELWQGRSLTREAA